MVIKASYPDRNFSLQQACHKFVMTRVQVCHKFVMTRVQACSKLTKAAKSPWNELAASLPCKLIANYSKNRVRTQPGKEPLRRQTSIPLRQLDYERRR
ncbi:hypothetical protein AVEN_95535-1 [Araneus ventricosus]|uniref:Uncharacterized protein n=1 Tax=Araneus ventricosus TaxID=182803 RepID=A0A4Y2HEL2_ARAVE|nr:hypothetical protein AVEN_95535-1 [Araneus ventricosus]